MARNLRFLWLLAAFSMIACDDGGGGPPVLPGPEEQVADTGTDEDAGETPADNDVEESTEDVENEEPETTCESDEDCPGEAGNPCLAGACDTETGTCAVSPAEAGTECNDGLSCTETDQCNGEGVCAGAAMNCDDDDPCTDNECVEGEGCKAAYNEGPCDDGDLCTLDDTCNNGDCFGTENLCDDGDACTTDQCSNETGECESTFNTGGCDDGDPCTGNDICSEGGCAGTALECDDGNTCTEDFCDPEQGFCAFTFDENCGEDTPCEPCDDEEPCTVADVCKNGQCGGEPNLCDDGDVCTDDACELTVGCTHTFNNNGCDDGNPCTENGACVDGVCEGSSVDCNDGKQCTVDACDPAQGCTHDPASEVACNDNDLCTTDDVCTEGACGGTTLVCDDGDICTNDFCTKGNGCQTSPSSDVCDDENACTENDQCAGGVCGGEELSCDDDNPCTDDSCLPETGCAHEANDLPCDDDNVCTEEDTCDGTEGACTGLPVTCDDDNPCTDDICVPATAIEPPDPDDEGEEEAGEEENGEEEAGEEEDGAEEAGEGEGEEEVGEPVFFEGGCEHTPVEGTPSCEDGSMCTENDLCIAGQCQGDFIEGCVTPVCGDDQCTMFEDCSNCPEDCGQCCGDGLCLEEETCLSCEADCGVCPPTFCETDIAAPYDSCGGSCNPIEGTQNCQENSLCVPTFDDPGVGNTYNAEVFQVGNGACGNGCAASFQCAGGSICMNANGLTTTGFCAQTCEPGDDSLCEGGTSCVETSASVTDAACLPGPLCDINDETACEGLESNVCIQLKPGTTDGVCMKGCVAQELYSCGDAGQCIVRDGPEWVGGTCVSYDDSCDPINHDGCTNQQSCVAEGGGAYGGIMTHCVPAGAGGEGAACDDTAETCQAGLICHNNSCTLTCNPLSGSAGCSLGQDCEDLSSQFNIESSIEGYFLGVCQEQAE